LAFADGLWEGDGDALAWRAAAPAGTVAMAKPAGLLPGWLAVGVAARISAFGALLVSDSGVGTAPTPTAIPRPSRAATDPTAAATRNDNEAPLTRAHGWR
jgi:hypothetical protein